MYGPTGKLFIRLSEHSSHIFFQFDFFVFSIFESKWPFRSPIRPTLGPVTFYSVGVEISFLTFLKEEIMHFFGCIGLWGLFPAVVAPEPRIGQQDVLIFGLNLDPSNLRSKST